MSALTPTHVLILLVVVLLLFGAKRLPEMARSVGRSSRILKSEMRGLHEDDGEAGAARRDRVERTDGIDS